VFPTQIPSVQPSASPTRIPTLRLTLLPTASSTSDSTLFPTEKPTTDPSGGDNVPTGRFSLRPTIAPTPPASTPSKPADDPNKPGSTDSSNPDDKKAQANRTAGITVGVMTGIIAIAILAFFIRRFAIKKAFGQLLLRKEPLLPDAADSDDPKKQTNFTRTV